ncbi:MAG: AI-2E family transporter [Caldilineaceae bacterium]|nr:AI-2E family transporter [Caldilineaceae bacterium]
MKRVALVTTIILLVLTLLLIAWRLQSVVGIFLLALVIALVVEEPIGWLTRRNTPRWLAVLAVYAGSVIIILVIGVIVFRSFAAELDPLIQDGLTRYGILQARIEQIATDRSVLLVGRLPTTDEVATMIVKNPETGVAEGLMAMAQRLLGMAGEVALAMVLAIYWSMDSSRFGRLWLSLLPSDRRVQLRAFLTSLGRRVGAYVRSEVVQTLLTGAALTALYALAGVPYPFALALFVSLAWLIPIIGGVIALLLAALIGWFAGWQVAIFATAATILVLAISEYVVQPRLDKSGAQLSGTLTVLLMLMLGDLLGIVGLIIAPPVALTIQLLLGAFFDRTPASGEQESMSAPALTAQLQSLKARTLESGAPLPRAVMDLVARLENLVNAVTDAPR